MSSTGTTETIDRGSLIWGVFAYLDAILSSEQKEQAGAELHGVGTGTRDRSRLRRMIAEGINETFRLQFWGCPLRKELDGYRLFHRNDMADALSSGYCLHKAGKNPVEAFLADYAIFWGGILSWEDIEAFRARAAERHSPQSWAPFSRFYQSGDRLVRYSLPTSIGFMLVRGDRLVWEEEALHMCVVWGDPQWEAAHAEFKRLGGNPAFFAGKFEWPPNNWVNPMTDEATKAELRRRRGTDEIDPSSPAALKFRDARPDEVSDRDHGLIVCLNDLLGVKAAPKNSD